VLPVGEEQQLARWELHITLLLLAQLGGMADLGQTYLRCPGENWKRQ